PPHGPNAAVDQIGPAVDNEQRGRFGSIQAQRRPSGGAEKEDFRALALAAEIGATRGNGNRCASRQRQYSDRERGQHDEPFDVHDFTPPLMRDYRRHKCNRYTWSPQSRQSELTP